MLNPSQKYVQITSFCGVPASKFLIYYSLLQASSLNQDLKIIDKKIRRTACHRGFFSTQFKLYHVSECTNCN